jgi:hypothetical protein
MNYKPASKLKVGDGVYQYDKGIIVGYKCLEVKHGEKTEVVINIDCFDTLIIFENESSHDKDGIFTTYEETRKFYIDIFIFTNWWGWWDIIPSQRDL